MKLEYAVDALQDLARLPKDISRRIMDKMDWFAAQDEPLSFAASLKNSKKGSYRFRVGDYRVIVDLRNGAISVLDVLAVRHRRDVYRD